MIEGILAAFPNHLKPAAVSERGTRGLVVAKSPIEGKVGIATGGGSGHIPLFLGYLGDGLADGVAIGDVFSSPSAEEMLEITREINSGKGVLYLYGNYGGDVMNFDMAAEMAAVDGIRVETSLGADDVASAPVEERASAPAHPRGHGGSGVGPHRRGAAQVSGLILQVPASSDRNPC